MNRREAMNNPLLDTVLHPDYPNIRADHIEPAISSLIAQARTQLRKVAAESANPDWDQVVTPLDQCLDALARCWGVVGHLNAVMDNPEWRKAYNFMLPQVTDFYTELEQDQDLFECYKKLQASMLKSEIPDRDSQRLRSLELAIQDFRLSGAELPRDQRARLADLIRVLSKLGQQFSEQVLDAMNQTSLYVAQASGLAGLPEDVVEAARESAIKEGREGWRFTAHMPSYLPVMQYAHDRELRQQMYRLYTTLASDQGDTRFDNGPLMQKILAMRQESASQLGFSDYVAMSLTAKMANSVQTVAAFLADLADKVKPQAVNDFAMLAEFAAKQLGIAQLEAWDVPYVTQQLKQRLFDFSDQDLKAYFQLDRVLQGLFGLIEELFGYRFEPVSLPIWHADVRCYAIYGEEDQAARAYVYLDLFSRAAKRSGAWMNVASNRRMTDAGMTPPMAWLTCNFQAPVGSRPALLTHDEVTTLFHEFGHGLHHVLTDMQEPRVSGLNGVEWDAVELPSQFLENFAWEWAQIERMTAHVETAAPMPYALYQRMLKARHFMMGMYLARQLEFGLFDLALHQQVQAPNAQEIMMILDGIRRDVAVVPYPSWNRFPHAFSHIFAGGYAAGYYSYLWAEVLSADCYLAFGNTSADEAGAIDTQARKHLGRRFLKEILSLGSVRPTMEHFKAFMNREPRLDALLQLYGIAPQGKDEAFHVA